MAGLYRRYRVWAKQHVTQEVTVRIGTIAGGVAAGLVSLAYATGHRNLIGEALPWLLLVGGPIAAFDAWGAARERGRPSEGWARAAVIVSVCGAGAWWLW